MNVSVALFQPLSAAFALSASDCPYVWTNGTCWSDRFFSLTVMALQAVDDFNARNGTWVPAFASLQGCDKLLSADVFDTGQTPNTTVQALAEILPAECPAECPADSPVDAIVGPGTSTDTRAVAAAAGFQGIPLFGYAATSADLDDRSSYPLLMRTIPIDKVVAKPLCEFYGTEFGYVETFFLHVSDSYGTGYAQSATAACLEIGVAVTTFAFDASDSAGIRGQVESVAASGIRVGMLVAVRSSDAVTALDEAYDSGLIGGNLGSILVLADGISLSELAAVRPDAQAAVSGSISIVSTGGTADNTRWATYAASGWPRLRPSQFASRIPVPDPFQTPDYFETYNVENGITRDFGAFEYDAVAAVALLACHVAPTGPLPDDFGTQLWDARQQVEFDGLSVRHASVARTPWPCPPSAPLMAHSARRYYSTHYPTPPMHVHTVYPPNSRENLTVMKGTREVRRARQPRQGHN